MTLVNDLLVKYAKGYVRVHHQGSIDVFGKHQDKLDLGQVQSELAAVYYGNLYLSVNALPRVTPTVDFQPREFSEVPYIGFRPGNRIMAADEFGDQTPVRVQSITIGEDADGHVTFGTELQTPAQAAADRLARIIRNASKETNQGRSQKAQPAHFEPQTPLAPRPPEWTPFSLSGPTYAIKGGDYPVPHDRRLVGWVVTCTVPGGGSGAINLAFYRNGSVFGTATVPASTPWYSLPMTRPFVAGDTIGVATTNSPSPAPYNLLVVPKVTG